MSHLKKLSFGMIEEGRLRHDLEDEFGLLQERLVKYVKEHGERSKGATATLTLKLSVRCENVEDGLFFVKSNLSHQMPGRPARSTAAMASEENGKPGLFGRSLGITETHPRQNVLCTEDGRLEAEIQTQNQED